MKVLVACKESQTECKAFAVAERRGGDVREDA